MRTEQMIIARMIGAILMVAPFVSLTVEVNETAPFSYQIYIWGAGVAIGLVGYALHRLGGGASFRDMIE